MQFKLTTDYAIRCVLYLAIYPGSASAETIGKAMGITPNYAQRILQSLKNNGIIYSIQGNGGGYVLARHPEDIKVLDIIKTQEQTMRINRCLEDDGFCSRKGVENNCPVHSYYSELQEIIINYLSKTSVRDLLQPRVVENANV